MPAERCTAARMGKGTRAAAHPLCCLQFEGTAMAVREALSTVMADLASLRLTDESAATVELVLAEVLNNVVEHAYGTGTPGPIDVEVWRETSPTLACVIRDRGKPMPDGTPPLGRQALVDVPLEEMPEGGFGWFLIRSLTRDLDYLRQSGGNRLSFRIPCETVSSSGA